MTLIFKVKILPDENDDLKASPLGRKVTGAISPVMKYSRVMNVIKTLIIAVIVLAIFGIGIFFTLTGGGDAPDPLPECQLPGTLDCVDYSVTDASMELSVKNVGGADVVIESIKVSSDAIEGGKCETGKVDVTIEDGSERRFTIGGSGEGACVYSDTGKSENEYVIKISHVWSDFNRTSVIEGKLTAGPPS